MKKFLAGLLVAPIVFVLAFSPVASAAGIKFAGSKVTPSAPCQNSTVTYTSKVVNSSGVAVKGAKVTFKVYYKTTTTPYTAGYTNSIGKVSKEFRIGRATPGYKVKVVSKAVKSGQTASITTSFTPKKCS